MKRILLNSKARLASIDSQIDSLRSRLGGSMIDNREQSVGPVERLVLEIELAELRMEHASLIAGLPM
jgi:hypothetical protein